MDHVDLLVAQEATQADCLPRRPRAHQARQIEGQMGAIHQRPRRRAALDRAQVGAKLRAVESVDQAGELSLGASGRGRLSMQ